MIELTLIRSKHTDMQILILIKIKKNVKPAIFFDEVHF